MRYFLLTTAVLAFPLLHGCSHLEAKRVASVQDTIQPAGAPYNLTFTQYKITVTRRVKSCFTKDKDDPKKEIPEMKIATTAELSRSEVRDPMREYVIDIGALQNFFKNTDIAIEYHDNGALKSVNATVEDRTADFLKSVISTAAKIATAAAGAGANGKAPATVCSEKTVKAVKAAQEAETELEKKRADLARNTARVEKLISAAAVMGRGGTAQRAKLVEEINSLYDAMAALDEREKALKDALAAEDITNKKMMTWPPDGLTYDAQLVPPLTPKEIGEWGSTDVPGMKEIEEKTGVWARFVSLGPSSRRAVCKPDPNGRVLCPDEAPEGLKYRMPALGKMQLCINAECTGEKPLLAEDEGLISQLGQIFTLPLRSYPFTNRTVALTFNNAGQPTKVGFISKGSAEAAAGVFGSLTDEVLKVREARKPKTELDLVKEEAELLEAKAKLATAKKALEPVPNAQQVQDTAALTAETTLLSAELAKIKAQAALEEARKLPLAP